MASGFDSTQQKPATYSMSKNQVAQSSAEASIYDDTGRGKQTQKVHRLLDQAKRVMAYEQKKAQKSFIKQQTKKSHGKSSILQNAGNTFLGSQMNDTVFSGTTMLDNDAMNAANARRIGPFSFDIDDDIDTEVLNNEQVYDDLKELDDILDQENDGIASSASIGKKR